MANETKQEQKHSLVPCEEQYQVFRRLRKETYKTRKWYESARKWCFRATIVSESVTLALIGWYVKKHGFSTKESFPCPAIAAAASIGVFGSISGQLYCDRKINAAEVLEEHVQKAKALLDTKKSTSHADFEAVLLSAELFNL